MNQRRTVAAVYLLVFVAACRSLSVEREPLRFGVIADVQYADKPTRGARRYAESLGLLTEAVTALNAEPGLAFVVQLGDLIDGRGDPGSRQDLEVVLEQFERLEVPVVHVVGNHCLEVPRAELLERLGLESGRRSFARSGWRFVALDSMEISVAGVPEDDRRRVAAEAWLATHPVAEHPCAYRWNGGIGPEQRDWLATELERAAVAGERVVLFAHHPLVAEASSPAHLAWDHADVLEQLDSSPVAVWMNGHDHSGGYATVSGVHHVTIQGMVEAPEGSNAWAVVELWPDRIEIHGAGEVPDRRLTSTAGEED